MVRIWVAQRSHMEIRGREIMTELLVRTGRLHPGGLSTVVGGNECWRAGREEHLARSSVQGPFCTLDHR